MQASWPRPVDGWLVDDVSITGVAGGGTIVISKNLGQGKFTLTGPIGQSGTAPLTTITNAPPGPYTVQFSDVTFYQTPPDQSLTLTNGGTITFTGNYTSLISIATAFPIPGSGITSVRRAPTARSSPTRTETACRTTPSSSPAPIRPTRPRSSSSFRRRARATSSSNSNGRPFPGRLYQVQSLQLTPPRPRPPSLSGSVDQLSGSFTLHINAPTNLPYAIQVSTNLAGWTSVYTNQTGGKLDFLDSAAAHSARRFYRTLGLPAAPPTRRLDPVTDWLQATGSPMRYTTTNANQGVHAYRVEVRP